MGTRRKARLGGESHTIRQRRFGAPQPARNPHNTSGNPYHYAGMFPLPVPIRAIRGPVPPLLVIFTTDVTDPRGLKKRRASPQGTRRAGN